MDITAIPDLAGLSCCVEKPLLILRSQAGDEAAGVDSDSEIDSTVTTDAASVGISPSCLLQLQTDFDDA